jgi:hypothetical protein
MTKDLLLALNLSLLTIMCLVHDYLWTAVSVMILLILVLNATFSNISAISWQPVLVVEEAGVPGENHRPWASKW